MINQANTYQPIVDWLTYRSYEANRLRSPHIPYYKWRNIYTDAIVFEEIYENHLERIYQDIKE
jgi:hypothetical protein